MSVRLFKKIMNWKNILTLKMLIQQKSEFILFKYVFLSKELVLKQNVYIFNLECIFHLISKQTNVYIW